MPSVKIICPNGHLGFAPSKPESFALGIAQNPDFIAADSGSDDIGPGPLGSDTSTSPVAWQTHDLEMMLLAARKLKVPMIIGSAGDTGTNSRVDLYVQIIKDLARKHNLAPFKLGYFYSELDKSFIREKLEAGEVIEGLDGRSPLTLEQLDCTDRIVAVAGVHPYMKLLEEGADVIIGGRSSDCAIFAAAALHKGCSEADSYFLGKVLECASFCAEPYGGKETVLGRIDGEGVAVTAMHPDQRCTIASVAGHAMYERSNPYFEYFAGGHLDMTNCRYTQLDEKTTYVTGQTYHSAKELRIKLEGAGKIGERYVGIAAIRDPYTIANIDAVIAWARQQVEARFGRTGYELHYAVYGRNGVMGALEAVRTPAHELCILVQGVAPTKELAEEICMTGTRQMFYARLPNVKGTAGGVAFPLDEVMPASPAYEWTLNHTIRAGDPLEFFPTHTILVQ
ncbi:acyclic terpene utilization AtuA family protein [Chelativorans composti]|uniref:Acyclic terpene utilization AtuA family protein n=1 Tax=Chelativorans composti TaxID=768533 RepID=A0ABW5DM63_9HYPH